MFILTNGKNYVMENPMKIGEYLATTSPLKAKEFTYKQARSLVQRGGKKLSWLRNYQLVDVDKNEESELSLYYKGNDGVYMDESNFDYSMLDKIIKETNNLLGLAGWDMEQLNTYKNLLIAELSRCDSAESDIEHALQTYRENRGGKKPQAHRMAKVGYLLDDIRDKHKKLKRCIRFIQVMEDAIIHQYTIGKIKLELSKVSSSEYKGRTKYYKVALELLGGES